MPVLVTLLPSFILKWPCMLSDHTNFHLGEFIFLGVNFRGDVETIITVQWALWKQK